MFLQSDYDVIIHNILTQRDSLTQTIDSWTRRQERSDTSFEFESYLYSIIQAERQLQDLDLDLQWFESQRPSR